MPPAKKKPPAASKKSAIPTAPPFSADLSVWPRTRQPGAAPPDWKGAAEIAAGVMGAAKQAWPPAAEPSPPPPAAPTPTPAAAAPPVVENERPQTAPSPPIAERPAKRSRQQSPALTPAAPAMAPAMMGRARTASSAPAPTTTQPVSPRAQSSRGLPAATGMPQEFPTRVNWFQAGLVRQPWATTFGLLAGWTGLFVAMWAAAIGLLVGGIAGAGLIGSTSIGGGLFHAGGGQAVTVIGVIGSAVLGAIAAFAGVYVYLLFSNPLQVFGSLLSGAILGVLLVAFIAQFEADLLRMRGYRRPSRDEVRSISPHVQAVGAAMHLSTFPRFVISDSAMPGAWTHMRHIVLSTALIDSLEPGQLRAVIAHEMHHWRHGDAVALRIVWAVAWPVALLYNLGCWLSGRGRGGNDSSRAPRTLVQIIGWVFLWPTWLITRYLIGPAVAVRGRQQEYEADAVTKSMGLSESLIGALRTIALFEPARSGWEAVMMASHPPTQLRIEALQQPRSDDGDYQEGDLGRVLIKLQ